MSNSGVELTSAGGAKDLMVADDAALLQLS
jgi:hypothetical protein